MTAVELSADGREVSLSLDNTVIWRGHMEGDVTQHVPLRVEGPEEILLRWAVEPPCPMHIPEGTRCRSVEIIPLADDLRFTRDPDVLRIPFGGGVTLEESYFDAESTAGEAFSIWLLWHFEGGRSADDIRFVHLLDESGTLVTQADASLGAWPPGTLWSEAIVLTLPDELAPGKYSLYAGWYYFPDLTRLAVQMESPRAQDGLAYLGDIHVMSP